MNKSILFDAFSPFELGLHVESKKKKSLEYQIFEYQNDGDERKPEVTEIRHFHFKTDL